MTLTKDAVFDWLRKNLMDENLESQESALVDIQESFVSLPTETEEQARGQAVGTIRVKLIQPGWGASGYYPEKTLREAAPKFTGSKMYWNHPSKSETDDRGGVRDLRDLAGQITSEPAWESQGPSGPGLYARAQVFPQFKETVKAIGNHIGVSIRASGMMREGSAEGRKGKIVESITQAHSVDFVTEPGAGGRIVSLFESARGGYDAASELSETTETTVVESGTGEDNMPESALTEAITALKTLVESQGATLTALSEDLRATRAELAEAKALQSRRDVAERALAGLNLSEAVKSRVITGAVASPTKIEDLTEATKQMAQAEIAYLAEATGIHAVRDMGQSRSIDDITEEAMATTLDEAFTALGLTKSQREIAVAGRTE